MSKQLLQTHSGVLYDPDDVSCLSAVNPTNGERLVYMGAGIHHRFVFSPMDFKIFCLWANGLVGDIPAKYKPPYVDPWLDPELKKEREACLTESVTGSTATPTISS